MQNKLEKDLTEAGFSLMELIIAITISLTVLSVAATLLASSFNTRLRENQKTDGLADAQRALNLMTREIANSGYGLTNNGIVAGDSSTTTIRVRANLNATSGETSSTTTTDRDEDIKYMLYTDGGSSYIVRLDVNTAAQETEMILIEGVMGLFDGSPSSADLAGALGVPVLAVIDASAMAETFGFALTLPIGWPGASSGSPPTVRSLGCPAEKHGRLSRSGQR